MDRRKFLGAASALPLTAAAATMAKAQDKKFTIALIPVAGAYVALPLFLLWYLRIFGGHGWTLTLSLTILTPIATFLFFEAVLKMLLPKGITEPLFLPLYAIFF